MVFVKYRVLDLTQNKSFLSLNLHWMFFLQGSHSPHLLTCWGNHSVNQSIFDVVNELCFLIGTVCFWSRYRFYVDDVQRFLVKKTVCFSADTFLFFLWRFCRCSSMNYDVDKYPRMCLLCKIYKSWIRESATWQTTTRVPLPCSALRWLTGARCCRINLKHLRFHQRSDPQVCGQGWCWWRQWQALFRSRNRVGHDHKHRQGGTRGAQDPARHYDTGTLLYCKLPFFFF